MTDSPIPTAPAALVALAQDVLATEIAGLAAVRERLASPTPEKTPLVLALRLLAACAGRVVVTGIGKSGLVGRKLAATFSSTGTPAFFLHPVEGAHGDLGSLRRDDVIIAISNSGETAELNAILPALKSLGASLIAMTGREDSTLGRLADVTLNSGVPREACPHGLAPTASTTAVLALGDALAVCLMHLKSFTEKDFLRYHPGGSLGQRLRLKVSEVMRTEGLPLLPETISCMTINSASRDAISATRYGIHSVCSRAGMSMSMPRVLKAPASPWNGSSRPLAERWPRWRTLWANSVFRRP